MRVRRSAYLVAAILLAPPPGPLQATSLTAETATMQPEMLFGFSVGEERRWRIESETYRFEPGELVQWTMRLTALESRPTATVAHFVLQHETRLFSRRTNILNPEEMDVVVTAADLWVNERGFPLRLEYREERSGTVVRSGAVEVVPDGERLRVRNPVALPRTYVLPVPRVGTVDMSRPEGVFVSADVNPGLLALPFALASREWREGDHFMAFDPSPLVDPRPLAPVGSDASVAPGASTWSMRRPPSSAQLAERSLRRTRLEVGPEEEIRIGGMMTLAHRVGVSSGNDAWITREGTVLRVDTVFRRAHASIRLLRAHEW